MWVLSFALLCLLQHSTAAQEDTVSAPHVTVLRAKAKEASGLEPSAASDRPGTWHIHSDPVREEELARTDVLYLDDDEYLRSDARVASLVAAVERGAKLVVVGAAVSSRLERADYTRILGCTRREVAAATPAEAVVIVENQFHPITQCVTHFDVRTRLALVELDAGHTVLARAARTTGGSASADELTPVVWVSTSAPNRVAVVALDPAAGPAEALAEALVDRCIEWIASGAVGRRLPDTLPVIAKRLPSPATGVFDGAPHRSGFYRGRQIAAVMSFHGAPWLVRPDREETEKPDKVLDSLDLLPGQTVADLGAGVGYFTLRMARRVEPGGKVLAVDVQKEMLDLLAQRLRQENITNVESILATEDDPKLPTGAIDLLLMVDVYHELAAPGPVLAAVRRSLKPDGKVVLVEYRGEDPAVPIKPLHRMTEAQAVGELEAVGFRWVKTLEFLPHQRILVFGLLSPKDPDSNDVGSPSRERARHERRGETEQR